MASAGSAYIELIPSLRGFQSKVKSELAGMNETLTVQLVPALDTARARGELDTLKEDAGGTVHVDVDADTAAAETKLSEVQAKTDRLDGRRANVDVDVDDHGSADRASSGLGSVLTSGLRLAAIIPVVAAVGSAVAGIGAAGVVGAAGLGAVLLGFSGVGGAVKAMGDAQTSAADDAGKAAQRQVQSAQQIASAQERVQSAESNLANTRATAADAAVRAEEQVRNAENSLIAAQRQALQAQQNLNAAREEARRSLQDLAFAVQDGALQQRQAVLDVQRAQQALQATMANPAASEEQRAQAQLTFDQASQQLTELQVKNNRLATDKAAADRAGIDGSKQVVTAQQQVQQANDKVAQAQQGLADAVRAQTAQQRQSAYSIAQAQQQVIDAQRSLQQAMTQTADTGSASMKKLNQAMADLSPAGQAFAQFLFGLKPVLDGLRATAQAGLLPGVQAGIEALLPVMPQITTVIGQLSSAMGGLFTQMGQTLASPFWVNFFTTIGSVAVPLMHQFGDALGAVAQLGGQLVLALLPVAPIALQAVGTLANVLAPLAPYIGQIAGVLSGALVTAFQALAPAVVPFGQALAALAPLAGTLLQVLGGALAAAIQALAPVITALAPPVTQLVGLFGGALIAAIQALIGPLAAIAQALGGVLLQYVGVYQQILPILVNLFVQIAGVVGTVLAQALQALIPVLQPMLQAFVAIYQALGQLIPPFLQIVLAIVPPLLGLVPLLTPLLVAVAEAFGQILPPLANVVLTLVNALMPAINALMPIVTLVFQAVVGIITWALNTIVVPLLVHVVIPAIQLLADVITWLLDSVVTPVFTGIARLITVVWEQSLRPLFNAIGEGVHGVGQFFEDVGGWIARTWDGIKRAAADPTRFVVDVIYNHGIVPVWNLIADTFGMPRMLPVPINFAGGGVLSGYSPGRDTIPAMLSPGEAVLTPEAVRYLGADTVLGLNAAVSGRAPTIVGGGFSGGGIARFAGGGIFSVVGDFLANVGRGTAKLFTDPGGFLRDALGLVTGGFAQFAQSPFVRGLAAIPGKFIDAAVHRITDVLSSFAAPGSGVQRWSNVALQALAMLGQPAGLLPNVLRRMNQESGGNPAIVNTTDSNWQAGTPSVGLMQVIGPTFARWAGPFAGTGPFLYGVSTNPLANVFAGLNYAEHAYPSLQYAMDKPGGYDSGGLLPPGLSTVYNGTRQPEAVLTGGQWDAINRGNDLVGLGISGHMTLDPDGLGGYIDGRITEAEHTTGTRISQRTRI